MTWHKTFYIMTAIKVIIDVQNLVIRCAAVTPLSVTKTMLISAPSPAGVTTSAVYTLKVTHF